MCQGSASAFALFQRFSLGTWMELLCSSFVIGQGWDFRVLGIGCSSFLKNNEEKVKH